MFCVKLDLLYQTLKVLRAWELLSYELNRLVVQDHYSLDIFVEVISCEFIFLDVKKESAMVNVNIITELNGSILSIFNVCYVVRKMICDFYQNV